MKTNRNELIRKLLSGVTDDELETWFEYGKKQDALFPLQEKWGSSN